MIIIQDTREQTPLVFKRSNNLKKVEVAMLEVGDYSILGYQDQICIERKSAADLFKSVSSDNARFQRELERAKSLEYFAIVVETTYTNILKKAFKGAKFIKMQGYVTLKILFTLKFKYNIDIFFCDGRTETAQVVRSLLTSFVQKKEKTRKELEERKK